MIEQNWREYTKILCSRDVNTQEILKDIPYLRDSLVLKYEVRSAFWSWSNWKKQIGYFEKYDKQQKNLWSSHQTMEGNLENDTVSPTGWKRSAYIQYQCQRNET